MGTTAVFYGPDGGSALFCMDGPSESLRLLVSNIGLWLSESSGCGVRCATGKLTQEAFGEPALDLGEHGALLVDFALPF